MQEAETGHFRAPCPEKSLGGQESPQAPERPRKTPIKRPPRSPKEAPGGSRNAATGSPRGLSRDSKKPPKEASCRRPSLTRLCNLQLPDQRDVNTNMDCSFLDM
eukprot:6876243-Pyramimonas_sp.AAC.2